MNNYKLKHSLVRVKSCIEMAQDYKNYPSYVMKDTNKAIDIINKLIDDIDNEELQDYLNHGEFY